MIPRPLRALAPTALLLAGFAACTGASGAPAEPDRPTVSAPASTPADAPEAAFPRISAEALPAAMAAPSDTHRVYVFWASWCGPCIDEMPTLKTLDQRHPDADVVLVNVDVATVQGKRLESMVDRLEIGGLAHLWLDARDPNADLRTHLPDWPESIPYVLVVSKTGAQVARFVEQVHLQDLEHALDLARATGG